MVALAACAQPPAHNPRPPESAEPRRTHSSAPSQHDDTTRSDCDRGDADSCLVLAGWYRSGGHELEALMYVTKGCEAGEATACVDAAEALESGEVAETDLARASALWKRACALGDERGCDAMRRSSNKP